jgi:hypothetical protein
MLEDIASEIEEEEGEEELSPKPKIFVFSGGPMLPMPPPAAASGMPMLSPSPMGGSAPPSPVAAKKGSKKKGDYTSITGLQRRLSQASSEQGDYTSISSPPRPVRKTTTTSAVSSPPPTPRMMTRRASFTAGSKAEPLISLQDKASPWRKAYERERADKIASWIPIPMLGFPIFILMGSLILTAIDALRMITFPGLIHYRHPERSYFHFVPGQPSSEAMLSFARLIGFMMAIGQAGFFRHHWTPSPSHFGDALSLALLNMVMFLTSFYVTSPLRHWPGVLNGAFLAIWALQLYLVDRFSAFANHYHSRSSVLLRMVVYSLCGAIVGQLLENYSIGSGKFYSYGVKEDRHAGAGYPLWLAPLSMIGTMTIASFLPILKAGGQHHHHHHH